MTTLGELRNTYSGVHREYNSKKYDLSVKLQKEKDRIENTPNGQELYGEKAATLELQYNALKEQQQGYDDFIQQFMEQWNAKLESVCAEQNAEATKDYYEDLRKIMVVAMRMSHGDIVPMNDEKRLMEYDPDMYTMAKNAQAIARAEERKKYKSLWDDEEKKEYEDPLEVADAESTNLVGPEVVSADSVMEAAVQNAAASQGTATVEMTATSVENIDL